MHGHMGHMNDFFKDLDVDMKNEGKTLVITVKGDEEKIKKLEKKLKALKDLCDGDCDCGCGCC